MSVRVVADGERRREALDPARSFIVQAPAGSGKTGLLIQRYLRLLATVATPEEVLAITFTRKAAAEMRRRVLRALAGARDAAAPERENDALTWALARAVLARDAERGWGILSNAARLRIQTIDSLCASLGRQMPVVSSLGAPPAIVEDARELYREAAERTLGQLSAGDAAAANVAHVLRHLDGDWGVMRRLMELMLARRDQWLRHVTGVRTDALTRAALEGAFVAERARALRRLCAAMPPAEVDELLALARFAAANIEEPSSAIAHLRDLQRFPLADESGARACVALAELLLKSDEGKPEFRRQVNKRQGFPAGRGRLAEIKERMHRLLDRLAQDEGLCAALNAVRLMPPAAFTDAQWRVLGAVIGMLPRAVAELQLVFSERGRIDFTGIAQAALRALGSEEEPTNLLLALDVQVQHLLVDEFQDTSHGQWDLFARLTAGWQPGDGRTVFLVGDPMQSIYRFREADVGLFLRARAAGLPQVALEDVRLETNFRAQAALVEWFNRHFRGILAPAEEPDEGAVPYSPSSAHHESLEGAAVAWHPFLGTDPAIARDREAACVADIVRQALAEPDRSIAILVRNRSNLDKILPLLRRLAIPFRAVEIESLQGRQVIQDLLAITRALSHAADRVAWLGLLRAPWCGMTLADLHALIGAEAASEGLRATVWELMHDPQRAAALSADGRARLERLQAALAPFVAHRLRGTLRERVEGAWLALGGPACAFTASDLDDADTFFDQLDQLDDAGELSDASVLEEHLERLYAAPDAGDEARVQVMTIHKAKGLEFDTVIVPGLDRLPRVSDRHLFIWKARADGSMLMAPIRAASEEQDAAYEYLRGLEKAAAQHELERLLYVAATRARRRLHLLGYARLVQKETGAEIRKPPPQTLLGTAWQAAAEDFNAAIPRFIDKADEKAAKPAIRAELRRLDPAVLSFTVAEPPCGAPLAAAQAQVEIEFSWAGETARHVGTITHRWLQRVATEGLSLWNVERISSMAPRIARELLRLGVPPADRDRAAARVLEALTRAVTDERGRWVLAAYPDARCEYRIRVPGPEGVKLLVIDRIFTEGGKPWIVDYKTSAHEGGDLETFLDREQSRYSGKMETYAPAMGGAPGKLGLYFPLVGGWREWEA